MGLSWVWNEDAANPHVCRLPHEVMMVPLLSLDMPNVVHLVLFDWVICSISLVAVDLTDNQVQGSVVTYMNTSSRRMIFQLMMLTWSRQN